MRGCLSRLGCYGLTQLRNAHYAVHRLCLPKSTRLRLVPNLRYCRHTHLTLLTRKPMALSWSQRRPRRKRDSCSMLAAQMAPQVNKRNFLVRQKGVWSLGTERIYVFAIYRSTKVLICQRSPRKGSEMLHCSAVSFNRREFGMPSDSRHNARFQRNLAHKILDLSERRCLLLRMPLPSLYVCIIGISVHDAMLRFSIRVFPRYHRATSSLPSRGYPRGRRPRLAGTASGYLTSILNLCNFS